MLRGPNSAIRPILKEIRNFRGLGLHPRSSPFEESMPQERKLLIAAHVRHDAPVGVYEYVLEVMKDGNLFTDPKEGDILFPQIVVETGA